MSQLYQRLTLHGCLVFSGQHARSVLCCVSSSSVLVLKDSLSPEVELLKSWSSVIQNQFFVFKYYLLTDYQ